MRDDLAGGIQHFNPRAAERPAPREDLTDDEELLADGPARAEAARGHVGGDAARP